MKKLLIITNIPSPYRVDFFYYLQKHVDDFEIHILFQSDNASSFRTWDGGESKLKNVHFLKSKVIRATGNDITEKFIPTGCKKELDSIRPDVVVCMEYNPTALITKHWCNVHKVPYISWSDGTRHAERNIKFFQKWFRKYIVRNTAAFIASSKRTKENQIYLGASEDKIFQSTLAIDIDRYKDAGHNYKPGNNIIVVGSLINRKGIDLLLEALGLLKDYEWKLELVGDGPEKENLLDQARKLGIAERIVFCGYLSGVDLTRAYEKSGMMIFPTREDCFGLVTLEAMCCGLPVISSKYADSAYDLIDEGITGLIVDPYDKKEMAEAIKRLLTDGECCISMSNEAKRKSLDYSFEKTSVGFMEAVRSVL